ncbi:MAG: Fur family transcriptional regulator, peroxide stress response regulator [Acidobacteriota bacterium]|jgi:Fe2+ or Zn2+ uptake regulation protein|nr:Fur family transcriptional regulator, peroxide stress response regulator [Acidobacteriota bacterium]
MTEDTRSLIEVRVRAAGLKLTPQRFAVLDYLLSTLEHPTAEQIHRDLNRRFPRASRATVYNTLIALCDAGLVHEIYMDEAVARYDANVEPHHHFVCRVCGQLEDVPLSAVGRLSRFDLQGGYRVENYEVVMRGVCATCVTRPARGLKDKHIKKSGKSN